MHKRTCKKLYKKWMYKLYSLKSIVSFLSDLVLINYMEKGYEMILTPFNAWW